MEEQALERRGPSRKRVKSDRTREDGGARDLGREASDARDGKEEKEREVVWAEREEG